MGMRTLTSVLAGSLLGILIILLVALTFYKHDKSKTRKKPSLVSRL